MIRIPQSGTKVPYPTPTPTPTPPRSPTPPPLDPVPKRTLRPQRVGVRGPPDEFSPQTGVANVQKNDPEWLSIKFFTTIIKKDRLNMTFWKILPKQSGQIWNIYSTHQKYG